MREAYLWINVTRRREELTAGPWLAKSCERKRSALSLAVNNMELIGSLLQNIAKYSDYVVIISVNS